MVLRKPVTGDALEPPVVDVPLRINCILERLGGSLKVLAMPVSH